MFLSVKLMTTLLNPLELGRVAMITTSVAFFALFLVNPVGMFVNRRLHTWYEDGRCQHYLHWYSLYILIVACVGVLAVIGLTMINQNLLDLSWAWVIMLVGGEFIF
jgi:O-antigen/teichoic acid export membrane protein